MTTDTAPSLLPADLEALPVLFVKIGAPLDIFGMGPCLVTASRETALANAAGIVYFWTSTIDGAVRYIVPGKGNDNAK
jgi:hypothetical protein